MLEDHTPKKVNIFGGLWSRDSFGDSVPQDHFFDSLNVITIGNEIRTRDGISKGITIANIRRTEIYKREGEASRLLILNNIGALYDATVSTSVPILNLGGAAFSDFSILTVYNRCYISPHNGVRGLPSEYVYVYEGSGVVRRAGGIPPDGGFDANNTANDGSIEEGTHLFAMCFETTSGFITRPGPVFTGGQDFRVLSCPGGKTVQLSTIQLGPSGTIARRIVASRAIQDYNGDQNGYEMFFVPGGRIEDNVTTSLEVDFFDAELISSADYLFDQLDTIPACLFIASYQDHICFGGEDANPSLVRVSKKLEPESVNELAGFIVCDPQESEGVKSAVEFRKSLYITKGDPGKTYQAFDNGFEASTWACDAIDKAIGAEVRGISYFRDQRGANADFFLAADRSGLFIFDGSYNKQAPLSYKIQGIWDRINTSTFHKLQIILDPEKFRVYILIALDSAASPNYILIGDYKEGFDAKNIKWHIWNSVSLTNIYSINVDIDSSTRKTYLRLGGSDGVYDQVINQRHDENQAIDTYIKFSYIYNVANWIHHFAAFGLRVKGSGTLLSTAYGEDDSISLSLINQTLSATPGREYQIPINFQNEKCSVKIRLNTANSYFILREFILYCQAVWANRPF